MPAGASRGRQVGAGTAQVLAAPGKSQAGPGRAGLWQGPPCTCPTWGWFIPLGQGVCAWDAQPSCCSGVCCAASGTSGCHLGMPWSAWLQGQHLPGCSLPFPCRNRLGKHIPQDCGARQEDANGQLVVFPAQALPTAPVPCSAAALGLSLRGEGVMQHDRQRRGSACATSLELPGW